MCTLKCIDYHCCKFCMILCSIVCPQNLNCNHSNNMFFVIRDFSYFTMKNILSVRFVGGFAMAGSVTAEQYATAKPDPIAPFASHVMK